MPPCYSFAHQVPTHGQRIYFGEGEGELLTNTLAIVFPQAGVFDGRVALIAKGDTLRDYTEAVATYRTDAQDRRVWLAWYPEDAPELDAPPLPDRTPGQQAPLPFLRYPANVHGLLARRLRENCLVPLGAVYSVAKWLSVLQLADPLIQGNQDVFLSPAAQAELLELLEVTYPFRRQAYR